MRLYRSHQSNAQAGCFKLAIHTQVIASKGAGPGDGDTEDGFAGYCAAPAANPFAAPSGSGP